MNLDQIASLVRTCMKILAGIFAAHGLTDTASIVNAPDVISAVLLIVSIIWSHYAHKSPDASSGGGMAALLLALALPSLLFTGCTSLDPGSRAVVVRAEQSITVANATFDAAVHIDDANTAFFRTNAPAFHRFCEWLRTPVLMVPLTNIYPRGIAIVSSADAVKNAYKSTNSTNDYALLISSLAVVESVTVEAQKFITETSTQK
ncbi:MAG: hypothetical protein PHY43_03875 [Verrucomicrobiales bacterium]|nr:hypothetical protein [Verrucomicrobiales bacterium]